VIVSLAAHLNASLGVDLGSLGSISNNFGGLSVRFYPGNKSIIAIAPTSACARCLRVLTLQSRVLGGVILYIFLHTFFLLWF